MLVGPASSCKQKCMHVCNLLMFKLLYTDKMKEITNFRGPRKGYNQWQLLLELEWLEYLKNKHNLYLNTQWLIMRDYVA